MARTLVTCPVCRTDQYIYRRKIARHSGETILTCSGSGHSINSLGEPYPLPYSQIAFSKIWDGMSQVGIVILQYFYETRGAKEGQTVHVRESSIGKEWSLDNQSWNRLGSGRSI